MRGMDGVEKDLRKLGVINWKTKAQERGGWTKFLEQGKAHKGLCQQQLLKVSKFYQSNYL
jgi:hypothetical protein